MINLHERMLLTSAGVEPATWYPVGRASNWATQAGIHYSFGLLKIFVELQTVNVAFYQTAPSEAVWTGCALFACHLSETFVYGILGHLP